MPFTRGNWAQKAFGKTAHESEIALSPELSAVPEYFFGLMSVPLKHVYDLSCFGSVKERGKNRESLPFDGLITE